MTSVGTSIFLRSSVWSVSENTLMHSYTPRIPACMPCSQGVAEPLGDVRARSVGAIERTAQVFEELRTVGLDPRANPIEDLHRQAAGICGGLQHQRSNRTDQHRLGHARAAMPADVARDLAASSRVSHMNRLAQIERLNELGEVVRVGVHVVAVPRLARSAVAAPVVRDTAVSVRGEKDHLVVPRVGAERPAVTEDNGLAAAPVLVVNLRAVSRPDPCAIRRCDRAHDTSLAADRAQGYTNRVA